MTCAYSVAVPGDPATIHNIASYTVDGFVFFTNQTQARSQSVKPPMTCTVDCTGFPTTAATPELGSGELLAVGLAPALGIVLYRRRRQRRSVR